MRTNRLIRPASTSLAALAGLGLFASCLVACAQAPAAGASATPKSTAAVVDFRSCEKPHYPAEDLAAGHEGTVTLAFLVDTAGKVSASKVVKSSGYRSMDEAARTAIAACQFTPATVDARPESTWVPIQYVWSQRG